MFENMETKAIIDNTSQVINPNWIQRAQQSTGATYNIDLTKNYLLLFDMYVNDNTQLDYVYSVRQGEVSRISSTATSAITVTVNAENSTVSFTCSGRYGTGVRLIQLDY